MVSVTKSLFAAVATLSAISGVAANCNIAGCISAMEGSGIVAAGVCAAAVGEAGLNPFADIGCVAALASTAVSSVSACSACTVAAKCDAGDATAKKNGCSQLGPNHCLQLKSSVPQPSKTDKTIDNYTFHCHNTGLVAGTGAVTCMWPCSQCDQCAGVPTNKRQLEAVMFEA